MCKYLHGRHPTRDRTNELTCNEFLGAYPITCSEVELKHVEIDRLRTNARRIYGAATVLTMSTKLRDTFDHVALCGTYLVTGAGLLTLMALAACLATLTTTTNASRFCDTG